MIGRKALRRVQPWGKAKDKSQPKGKGSKVPEKGKDKSQPKGKGAKGLDKGKQGPGGKSR